MTRCPTCERRHRTPNATGRCIRDAAEWIHGAGRWALLAYCDRLTVTLHPARRDAEQARTFIDRSGCGSRCHRTHLILDTDGMNLDRSPR